MNLFGFFIPSIKQKTHFLNIGCCIRKTIVFFLSWTTLHISCFWIYRFPKLDEKSLLDYLRKNLAGHIEDAQNVLKKPLILGEFGKPSDAPGYTQAQRDAVFTTAFDIIYVSAQKGGAAAGALFWHLISDDMNNFRDAYSISLSEKSSTINIIGQQSRKMNLIGGKGKPGRKNKIWYFKRLFYNNLIILFSLSIVTNKLSDKIKFSVHWNDIQFLNLYILNLSHAFT